ncbi:reverse transcriptase domain-containing protein [Tanacetum coccineum]
MKETPYELLEDDQKKKLDKNNKAKMTLYNALPLKEYKRIFIAKVMTIEEAKDLATLPLDELIGNLKVYEMVLDNDGVGSKTTKEKVKSLALKAKVTREQTSDDSDSQGGSDEYIDEEEAEAFNLLARNFRKFFRKDVWIVDSSCTKHITGNRRLFTLYKAYDGGHVVFGSNLKGKVVGGGQLCDDDCVVSFTKVDRNICKNDRMLAKGHRRNGLYMCKLGDNSKQQICLASVVDNSMLWHRRLGPASIGESRYLSVSNALGTSFSLRPILGVLQIGIRAKDDGSQSSGGGIRRPVQPVRVCSYPDFIKCQPLNFKGTEGVVGLSQWLKKIESVFHVSGCAVENQVKFATCTLLGATLTWWNGHVKTLGHDAAYAMTWGTFKKKLTDKYCPKGEIKKLEIKLWNLKVRGNDVAAYTQRFQELALMCTKFLVDETAKIDKYIGRLPDNIHGNVMSARPKTLDFTIELANNLMDHKLRTYAERQAENKRKLDNNNQAQQ